MDDASTAYYDHSSGQRIFTNAVILRALRNEHPGQQIVSILDDTCNLLEYAEAGYATATLYDDLKGEPQTASQLQAYRPPRTRLDGNQGDIIDQVNYGRYIYEWKTHKMTLVVVSGRDGTAIFSATTVQYVIGTSAAVSDLVLAAGGYTTNLHDQIWVFNTGFWSRDSDLWLSVQKASWDNVILDNDMKTNLKDGILNFFDSRDQYNDAAVPWKRGMMFYGPPGNGKTISIKATMHMLYDRKPTVPTLYVKTLSSFEPPEYSLTAIFSLARRQAPCLLVFEDLDSFVTDRVRSFFLNEMDGIRNNDGILVIGSTNHLDRLDPGISNRPSRFDRKYNFPNPNFQQRVSYCQFWQKKLKSNKRIEFPDVLCPAIAKITDKFSFAYIQEAFIATLVAIGIERIDFESLDISNDEQDWEFVELECIYTTPTDKKDDDSDLEKYALWREIKSQIRLLRQEMEGNKV